VVDFRSRLQNLIPILWCFGEPDKLGQHWLFICLCCSCTVSNAETHRRKTLTVCSLTIFTLHRGPKPAILTASILILCGNWLRYVGAKVEQFTVVMTGQILIGLAQPFVLSAPTKFSDTWFSPRGRTSATALASLANPLGGAVGIIRSNCDSS
jgi:hypothetical protein